VNTRVRTFWYVARFGIDWKEWWAHSLRRDMPHLRLKIVVSGIALAAILARYVFHLQMDGVMIGLLCLGILPWLAPLIKSFDIPGVIKVELQEIKTQAEQAKGAADSADQKAELALANASVSARASSHPTLSADTVVAEWQKCVDEYNQFRQTMAPGGRRTAVMTQAVSKMIALAPLLTNYAIGGELRQKDRGRRLGAYVFLYCRPNQERLDELISSVVQVEDTPFGQYWGIQALQHLVSGVTDQHIIEQAKHRLQPLLASLQPGTDRHYELMKLL